MRRVSTITARKETILELGDAFIVLPGGVGTLDEFFFVLARARMGLHEKPCGILNTLNYYSSLLRFLDHMIAEEFLRTKHLSLFVEENPDVLLTTLLRTIDVAVE